MSERMRPTDVLKDPNFRKLSLLEELSLSAAYQKDLTNGLQGGLTSLAMIPSLLRPVDLHKIDESKEALVVEVGGTHLYGARVVVKDGKPFVKKSTQVAREGTKFENAEKFFEMLVSELSDVLEGSSPDALGIIFSFAADAVRTERGVDVVSQSKDILGKEIVIPGINSSPVGEMLIHALASKLELSPTMPIVSTNDTVAVELAGGASIGAVVATGFNLAFDTDQGIVNTESARFDKIPKHRLADMVDKESQKPGHALAEKQISGLYLGRQFALATGNDASDATTISEVLTKEVGEDYVVAETLRDRSAQIVGVMMGAVIGVLPQLNEVGEVHIPVEGSLFWKMPGYASIATDAAQRIAGKKVEFQNIPDAGRVGAGVAALSMLAKK